MKTHAIRLSPGEDVYEELNKLVKSRGISAACIVSAAGSLTRAFLRFGGQDIKTLLGGQLELISLSGTLSPDGCHLHASIANEKGEVLAGHLLHECMVRTTVEVIVLELEGLAFTREHDQRTGYRELVINALPGASASANVEGVPA